MLSKVLKTGDKNETKPPPAAPFHYTIALWTITLLFIVKNCLKRIDYKWITTHPAHLCNVACLKEPSVLSST